MATKKNFEEAKRLYETANADQKYVLERLFPELAESDNERIRKAIHIYLDWLDGRKDYAPKGEYSIKDMIAWLEKQKEATCFAELMNKLSAKEQEAMFNACPKEEEQDEQTPAWSEVDEKIWEEISDMIWEGYKQSCSKFTWDDIRGWIKPKIESFKDRVQPKQEWSEDDETVLNNLIFALANDRIGNNRDEYVDWLKSLRPQPRQETTEEEDLEYACQSTNSYTRREQMIYNLGIIDGKNMFYKPANWSEEDEKMKKYYLAMLDWYTGSDLSKVEEVKKWIDSLKDRVQPQPKQEWSEEDSEHITSLIERLDGMCNEGATFIRTRFAVSEDIDWLKSLRPQNTWKPSDEQMIAIQEAMNIVGVLTITGSKINSLYQDLKKIKE